MNGNEPTKTVVTKKVITTMPTGMAKPIPINSVDAVNIAREQEQLRKMAEEQAKLEEQAMLQMQNNPNINNLEGNIISNNQEAIQNVDNSVAQFNEVNDLVKVVDQKNNPKLVAVMILILLIIVIIIIIQVPMLFNL